MPYLVVLAITLLLVAGSVVFVRMPPWSRNKPALHLSLLGVQE